ncbi:MAG: response regulator [Candidatus Omnitrophica bacterium]|nr:response regulator [Candidatus Omnitrophota bacterium]
MENRSKILVVDDEQEFLSFMKEHLELHGYDVVLACDGEEGIVCVKKHSPDLIICDIRMPKQDGFYVLRELRHSGDSKTPFIMVTAFDDFNKTRDAYNEEADFYLTKPVAVNVLMNNIKTLLSIKANRL